MPETPNTTADFCLNEASIEDLDATSKHQYIQSENCRDFILPFFNCIPKDNNIYKIYLATMIKKPKKRGKEETIDGEREQKRT